MSAVKAGIVAGVSAAVTLAIIGVATFFYYVRSQDSVQEKRTSEAISSEAANRKLSPEFAQAAVGTIGFIAAEWEARRSALRTFEAASADADKSVTELLIATRTEADRNLWSEISAYQGRLALCVKGALGAHGSPHEPIRLCEDTSPFEQIDREVKSALAASL